jgi:hypothetical protein
VVRKSFLPLLFIPVLAMAGGQVWNLRQTPGRYPARHRH